MDVRHTRKQRKRKDDHFRWLQHYKQGSADGGVFGEKLDESRPSFWEDHVGGSTTTAQEGGAGGVGALEFSQEGGMTPPQQQQQ